MHLNILLLNLKADQYVPYIPHIIPTSDSSLPMTADKYTEAIIRVVPLVGIPVFADQRLNMARGVLAGSGLIIDFRNITSEL
jgi:hypothetical protein